MSGCNKGLWLMIWDLREESRHPQDLPPNCHFLWLQCLTLEEDDIWRSSTVDVHLHNDMLGQREFCGNEKRTHFSY